MKQLKCYNGELVTIDSDLYNTLKKHTWHVYYQKNRRPRIVTADLDGSDTNLIRYVIDLDPEKRHRWTFINGDNMDYRRDNILMTGNTDKHLHIETTVSERVEWEKCAKDRGRGLSELIRVTMAKECRK